MSKKNAGLLDLLPMLNGGEKPIDVDELANMMGGKVVTFNGMQYMKLDPPTSHPRVSPDIIFSNDSGIVGVLHEYSTIKYFIGVPKAHKFYGKDCEFFNGMKIPLSLYGNITSTSVDSAKENGCSMIPIELSMVGLDLILIWINQTIKYQEIMR